MAKAKKGSKKKAAPKAAKKSAPKKPAAKKKVAPIPPGYYTVTPYLVVRGAAKAIDFYKRAFGAKEKLRMEGPDGRIAHAEIAIGDSIVMVGDEMPQMGITAPQTVGGTTAALFIYTKNVDDAYAKAMSAGASSEQAPMNMFWGDRYAKLVDPFGHKWSMATHIEDVSPKEMARRGAEAMSQQPPPNGPPTS
jgi:PhnB protein